MHVLIHHRTSNHYEFEIDYRPNIFSAMPAPVHRLDSLIGQPCSVVEFSLRRLEILQLPIENTEFSVGQL